MSHIIPFPGRAPIVVRRPDLDDDLLDDDVPPVLFDEQEDHEDIAIFERMYETSLDE